VECTLDRAGVALGFVVLRMGNTFTAIGARWGDRPPPNVVQTVANGLVQARGGLSIVSRPTGRLSRLLTTRHSDSACLNLPVGFVLTSCRGGHRARLTPRERAAHKTTVGG